MQYWTATLWLSADEQRSHLQATRRLLNALDAQLQRDAGPSHTW